MFLSYYSNTSTGFIVNDSSRIIADTFNGTTEMIKSHNETADIVHQTTPVGILIDHLYQRSTDRYEVLDNFTDNINASELLSIPLTTRWLARNYILGLVWIIVGMIGVTANILACMVSMSNTLRMTSHGMYMTFMCIIDIGILAVYILIGALFLNVSITQQHWQPSFDCFLCTIFILLKTLKCLSSWIVIALIVDRIMSLSFPLKRLTLCTRRAAIIGTGIVALIVSVVYVPSMILILFRQRSEPSPLGDNVHSFSRYVCYSAYSWYRTSFLLHLISAYLVPFVVIIICTSILLYIVRVRSRKANVVEMTDQFTAVRIRANNQLSVTLMLIGLLHIVLTATGAVKEFVNGLQKVMSINLI